MAWRRVNHPSEILNVGDTVKVQIIRINPETQRISLGMKQLQSDPWSAIEAKYPVGAKLKGTVTNIADYGAFVELEPGVEGLIHVSEMSWTKKNVHPGKIVSTSQQVDVQVLEVDPTKRRISLGLKQTQDNPWDAFLAAHPKGSIVEGPIRNITEFGLFIGLDNGIDGMVHLSDLDWSKPGDELIKEYKKGDNVKAMVLDVDSSKERISLGIKQLAGDPADTLSRYKKGDTVTCEVVAVQENGIEVKIADSDITVVRQALRSLARSLRAAPRALHGRPEGRCRGSLVRQGSPPHHGLDQGARDRRREAGRRAIRFVGLGRLARRHLQGRHQEAERRHGRGRGRIIPRAAAGSSEQSSCARVKGCTGTKQKEARRHCGTALLHYM